MELPPASTSVSFFPQLRPTLQPMSPGGERRLTAVEQDGSYATVVVTSGGVEVARWAMARPITGRLTMATVDEVARLVLSARRMGCVITLRDVAADVVELLELAGLVDVLPRELRREMGRKPEGFEQAGVEEAVEGSDPVA